MNNHLIILEMANNHMGDLSHAKKIIKKYSSITKRYKNLNFALKFQLRDQESFIDKSFKDSNDKQIVRFKSTFLSLKKWRELVNFSNNHLISLAPVLMSLRLLKFLIIINLNM